MRNAELIARGSTTGAGLLDRPWSCNSALRIPHSALACPEVRLASDARTRDPGRFGRYGGRYVPETLMAALEELDRVRSEEHTSELQSHSDLVCRLLLEKKKKKTTT